MDIAFIGLGVMGAPMAGHLHAQGHRLRVYNRSSAKALAWQERYGGEACDSIAQAASQADVLVTCVGNDDDLRQVCLGDDGAYVHMADDALHIDHTTSSAEVARTLADAAAKRNIAFVDAPVSGGQAGAEEGSLTIMAGGSDSAFSRAREIFGVYAKREGHMGPVGNGQLTKMVNQICIGGLLQSLSEALVFAEKAGLDVNAALDVIEHGAAGSWQMSHRGRSMHLREFDFGFAVDWMRKDLNILMGQARAMDIQMPITRLIQGYYDEISASGGGRWDTSALITRLDGPQDPD